MGFLYCGVHCMYFATNGYFLNHFLVEHLIYCSITIIAVVPYIISSSWSQKSCILVFSLCITHLVYFASFPAVFLLYISLGQLFLFLPLTKRDPYQYKLIDISPKAQMNLFSNNAT